MNTQRTEGYIGPDRSQPIEGMSLGFWLAMAEGPRLVEEPTHADCDWDYRDAPFQKSGRYKGALAHLPEDEAMALLQEALRYFDIYGPLPSPPSGLPGTTGRYNVPAKLFAEMGVRYLIALIHGRTRTIWSEHDEIVKQLNKFHEARVLADQRIQRDREIAANYEAWADAEPRPDATVYFIGADDGPVKIGIATCVKKRLYGLQTSNPNKLYVLATCPGGHDRELEYHAQFAAHRLSGEWFERTPELLAEITRLARSAQ